MMKKLVIVLTALFLFTTAPVAFADTTVETTTDSRTVFYRGTTTVTNTTTVITTYEIIDDYTMLQTNTTIDSKCGGKMVVTTVEERWIIVPEVTTYEETRITIYELIHRGAPGSNGALLSETTTTTTSTEVIDVEVYEEQILEAGQWETVSKTVVGNCAGGAKK